MRGRHTPEPPPTGFAVTVREATTGGCLNFLLVASTQTPMQSPAGHCRLPAAAQTSGQDGQQRGGSHVAGAGRVGLQGAGEAEAVAAGALRLAVHLAGNPDGSPAVRHTGAPPHQLVVLRMQITHQPARVVKTEK